VKLLAPVLAALVLAAPASGAGVRSITLAPAEDVSLPFFCDWGYDWDERCYRDDSGRLSVGGEPGKVWRSALRFPLAAIPSGAVVVTAELSLWYDGTCVGARKQLRRCEGRAFDLETHRILTARWSSEREVDSDPLAFTAALAAGASPGWVSFDVTDLVADWAAGVAENDGVLVRLADDEEAYDTPGPAFPSTDFPDASLRPRLTVWWLG
jgi:TGF-beta propeptide